MSEAAVGFKYAAEPLFEKKYRVSTLDKELRTTSTAFFVASCVGPETKACNGSSSPGRGTPGLPY